VESCLFGLDVLILHVFDFYAIYVFLLSFSGRIPDVC
jgi:hypothetical protein